MLLKLIRQLPKAALKLASGQELFSVAPLGKIAQGSAKAAKQSETALEPEILDATVKQHSRIQDYTWCTNSSATETNSEGNISTSYASQFTAF